MGGHAQRALMASHKKTTQIKVPSRGGHTHAHTHTSRFVMEVSPPNVLAPAAAVPPQPRGRRMLDAAFALLTAGTLAALAVRLISLEMRVTDLEANPRTESDVEEEEEGEDSYVPPPVHLPRFKPVARRCSTATPLPEEAEDEEKEGVADVILEGNDDGESVRMAGEPPSAEEGTAAE